ncbi:hypothetical protein QR680_017467 [Steinernema hermaphroditum]|uniref:Uncharacterized protein n=1 Tax=Steinernema hermaphroditum TaxID=289476 RepID=A0AA39HEN9_9BILA|nr:hypothetical protein QR680_017467 [Steinernema hermaphroditum]
MNLGIIKHLELHHKDLYEKLQERKANPDIKKRKLDDNTPTITAAFEAWRPGGTKLESINRALSLMIAVDSQPLSMVDRTGFRYFLNTVVPNYSIRSRTSIYPDGKLEYRILGVLPIHGRHTADNLSAILSSCMADFIGDDALRRTHLIVRDAATVMKKTTRLCGLTSVDCFAHKIQLAVYGGIKTVLNDFDYFDDVIERVKKFIRKMRKSGNDRDDFADLQKLQEIQPRWLIKGIEIRWGSLYDMIDRFLENRSTISSFLIGRSKYPQFTSGDYVLMEKILSALKPMKQATVMLQGRQVTISVVVPTIYVLRRALVSEARRPSVLSPNRREAQACNRARTIHG